MPCYRPIQAVKVHDYSCTFTHKSGKQKLYFGEKAEMLMQHPGHEVLYLPCYWCVGCRRSRAKQWAVRCAVEAQSYEKTSMLTLTYDTGHLPNSGSLVPKDLRDFWKRLRVNLKRKKGIVDLKYFACGEYGDNYGRPHYHAILFGWDFPDDKEKKREGIPNNDGAKNPLYKHPDLTEWWGMGNAYFSPDVGVEAAFYVSKYAMKAVSKKKAETEGDNRVRAYNCMSNGIGDRWFDKNKRDCYPRDYVSVVPGGPKMQLPRRWDQTIATQYETGEEYIEWIKARRIAESEKRWKDNTPERMKVREELAEIKAKLGQKRRLDSRLSPQAIEEQKREQLAQRVLLERRRKELSGTEAHEME